MKAARGSDPKRSAARPALAWVAALVLPGLATVLTSHLELLRVIPASLFIASIAVTASFGLLLPTGVCIALSFALYNYFIAPPYNHWSLQTDELMREAVLAFVSLLIASLILRLRRAQAALAASEAVCRTTLASIADGVIATDFEGAVTFMNSRAEELTGWSEREVKGKPLASFVQLSPVEQALPAEPSADPTSAAAPGTRLHARVHLQRRDGQLVLTELSRASIRNPTAEPAGEVLVLRDARRRRQMESRVEALLERAQAAERELLEAVSLYQDQAKGLGLAQQAGKSAAWVLDVERQKVKFLPGGYEIFGMPFDQLATDSTISLIEEDDKSRVAAAFQRTSQTGAPVQVEYRLRWPNGEIHCQEARGVRDPEDPNLIRGTTFDITDRKQAELSLLRIEKLAAVGRIASTIAHEINNPLASVTNLLYLALLDPSVAAATRAHLLTAEQELSRLSNITRLTLSYARPQSQARDIDPAEVIEGVLALFRIRIENRGIQCVRVCPEPFLIHIYSDELQRILTNLIANAIDATAPSGGIIRIEMDRLQARARIAIADNGVGIPADRFERIFDPFFTTKEEVGTGIGLWVTKELVEKNGGSISLFSGSLAHGMTTRFELYFPILSAPRPPEPGDAGASFGADTPVER